MNVVMTSKDAYMKILKKLVFMILALFAIVITALSNAQSKSIYYPDFQSPEIIQSNTDLTRENIQSLIAVDLETGKRTLISGKAKGTGQDFESPSRFSLNSSGDQALVWDKSLDRLFHVELSTGNRSVLPLDIEEYRVLDPYSESGRAIALNANREDLDVINLYSGKRSSLGIKAKLEVQGVIDPKITGSALDEINNRVIFLVSDRFQETSVYELNLDRGALNLISRYDRGEGPAIGNATTSLEIDVSNNKIYLSDLILDSIFSVDLSTGDRTEISGPNRGEGLALDSISVVVLDIESDRLFIAQRYFTKVLSVDINTGDRQLLSVQAFPEIDINTSAGALDRFSNRIIFNNVSPRR